MWFLLALGSSVFAALTSILAKIGIDGVKPDLHGFACDVKKLCDGMLSADAL